MGHSLTGKEQLASCRHCTMANIKKQSHVVSKKVKKYFLTNDFHTSEDNSYLFLTIITCIIH